MGKDVIVAEVGLEGGALAALAESLREITAWIAIW